MRRTATVTFFVCVFVVVGFCQKSITIASDSNDLSRPISTLLDQVREHQKVAVTYEDPRYSNSADIQDVTAQVSRNPQSGHRTLVPKGRAMTFVYASQDFASTTSAEATIARMLQEYRALGGPTFTVMHEGVRLRVVPSDLLDASGNRVQQQSILDTVVAIPAGSRDGGQLIQAICDQVKKQTGYEIGIGPSAPSNNLELYRTTEAIDNVSARSAIERVLDKSSGSGNFVWDLYYDPGEKSYGLNFVYVGAAGPVQR
jgi:hypothetical protein